MAATALVAAVLVIASFALVELQRRALTENIDTSIGLRADDLGALLLDGALPGSLGVSDGESAFVQVVDADGEVVAASPNLAAVPAVASSPLLGASELGTVSGLPIDDEAFRVLSRTVSTPDGHVTIHVGGSLEVVGDSIENLWAVLRIGVPLLVAAVAFGTWALVGRALSPVEDIRREVAAITDQELGRRVPEPSGDNEIARLAQTMNRMLERLQAAHDRQARFVADASHELRTPLASLRTQIDVDLADQDVDAVRQSLQDEVVRMQELIDDLLVLARSDAVSVSQLSLVDLDDIVLSELRGRPSGTISISTTEVSAGQVRGERRQLARAFRNLIDNAVRHARSKVSVSLREEGERIVLAVTDDGDGVPEHARREIFERFSRLDSSRGRERGGAGLGLAIVRAVAEVHGGSIAVDPDYSNGARFVLSLPAAKAATGTKGALD